LAWGYFPDQLPARESAPEAVRAWFAALLAVFVPGVDRLDELPAKVAFLFGFDTDAVRATEENSQVLSADSARTVLAELADRARAHAGPVRAEEFKIWMDEVKAATGVKGKELFHPVRIALTGSHSGREFDKLIPLIEDGASLGLGIPSVCERIERFVGV
jgi:nondiscriminating glutamyl-tRNA synthetase